MDLRRGIIRQFDSGPYLADVQMVGSMATVLTGVPVAKSIGAELLTAGANCGVLFFDPTNPADACVAFIYEGAPGAWVDSGLLLEKAVTFAKLAASAKGQIQVAYPDTPQSTTSTSWVDMTGESLTLSIPEGQTADLLLIGLCTAENDTAGGRTQICINWQGSDGLIWASEGTERKSLAAMGVERGLGEGSYTAKLCIKVTGGTGIYRSIMLVGVLIPAS